MTHALRALPALLLAVPLAACGSSAGTSHADPTSSSSALAAYVHSVFTNKALSTEAKINKICPFYYDGDKHKPAARGGYVWNECHNHVSEMAAQKDAFEGQLTAKSAFAVDDYPSKWLTWAAPTGGWHTQTVRVVEADKKWLIDGVLLKDDENSAAYKKAYAYDHSADDVLVKDTKAIDAAMYAAYPIDNPTADPETGEPVVRSVPLTPGDHLVWTQPYNGGIQFCLQHDKDATTINAYMLWTSRDSSDIGEPIQNITAGADCPASPDAPAAVGTDGP